MPATTLAGEIARHDRSARDTVSGAITTAKAQQARLNVCTFIDEDRAIERAEQIDAAIDGGRVPGPLAGVPIVLKDLIDHIGRATTCGSGFYSRIADRSATVVDRLEAAGAVVIARTVLHEFAYGFSSENHWTGPVRNPLDPELSCGGSSGGSAAAVAAGQVPIGIGTDTGGSVRVPAAMCGLFGLKVTQGRIPIDGVFPLAPTVDTVGPIASTTDDLAVAYAAMAGYHPADPWSRPHAVASPAVRPDLRGLRVGIPAPWVDDAPITLEVVDAFAAAVDRLRELGASVERVEEASITSAAEIGSLVGAEAARIHRAWVEEGKPYGPEVARRLEPALAVTGDDYITALEWRALARQRMEAIFGSFDLLVTPTTGATRKVIGTDTIATQTGDVSYRPVLSWFTAVVNQLGCPAIVGPLPGGTPPPSLQLVGPHWSEHRLLEVASILERHEVLVRPA